MRRPWKSYYHIPRRGENHTYLINSTDNYQIYVISFNSHTTPWSMYLFHYFKDEKLSRERLNNLLKIMQAINSGEKTKTSPVSLQLP